MKLRTIALAALAAAAATPSFALSPTEVAANDVVKVYVSGASALRNVIGGLFTQHCDTDLDIYYSKAGSTMSGVSFAAAGDAHRVYACTMKGDSPILAGVKVAFFKSDIGGSGQGVFPVALRADRNFLALSDATCGTRVVTPVGSSAPNYQCSTEQVQVPSAGVSDVEPALFKTINVPKDDPSYPIEGLSDDQLAALDSAPLFQTIFGVAVTKNLRDQMQAAQSLTVGDETEANQPSISKAAAFSYFAGKLNNPGAGRGWQPLVPAADANKATQVNVCRRVDGSGTQASANAFFAEFPCNGAGGEVATAGSSTAAALGTAGRLHVKEGSSTGNVITCLNDSFNLGAYAIGHVSKENAPATTGAVGQWRHVKLDGVAPKRDNVKKGAYNYYYESTMQWNGDQYASLSFDQQDFLTQFRDVAGLPESLAKLSTSTQEGVAALPTSYAGAFLPDALTDAGKFGSRVRRGGNSCAPSTFVK